MEQFSINMFWLALGIALAGGGLPGGAVHILRRQPLGERSSQLLGRV